MPNTKWFAAFAIAAIFTCDLPAENHCPGNVASLPYRLVKGHLMVIEVSINHSGPLNFLLDTGTHSTLIDPSLVAEYHLAVVGRTQIASLGSQAIAPMIQVPLIEAGGHVLSNQDAVEYDLSNLPEIGIKILGILGEGFLGHFDVLFDNSRLQLCLDEGHSMRSKAKGTRVPLVVSSGAPDGDIPSLVVEARVSGVTNSVRLMLDSGANQSVLFNAPPGYASLKTVNGTGTDGSGSKFIALPNQTLRIGQAQIPNVHLFAFAHARKGIFTSEFDGLLSMGLFRKVFVDHADRFLVVEPW